MSNLLSGMGFGSNPFSTRVGQQIELATDRQNASEDWGAFMNICDEINSTEEGPKDAMKAIKKRLHSSVKEHNVVLFTLTLLETCVKNCGRRFHVCIAQKDFMQEMVKVLAPKNEAPTVVQEKILGLIQAWSEAFRGQPDLKEVEKTYVELKNKGIEFPMMNLDQAPPIHTPARSVAPRPMPQSPTHQPLPPHPMPTHPPPAQQQPYPPSGVPPMQGGVPPMQGGVPPVQHGHAPGAVGPEYFVKLRGQLDVVEGNMRVFNEMMTELQAHSAPPDDWQLMTELSATCKQMQQRIMLLLQQVQHEEVTGELLRINDELNNVFVRWERFARGRPAELQTSQAPPVPSGYPMTQPSTLPSPQSTGHPIAQPSSHPAPQPYPAPAATRMAQVTANPPNLIDFDDPPPVSSATAAMGALSVNNSDGRVDDFDMFAQSRTDTNQSARTGSSYADQRQTDFASGLGTAMNARATGQPVTDATNNYDEMEQWLKDNPESGAPGAQAPSMTSSEFDRFLSERATAAESLPAAGSDVTRRRLQGDEGKDTMFAL